MRIQRDIGGKRFTLYGIIIVVVSISKPPNVINTGLLGALKDTNIDFDLYNTTKPSHYKS